MRVIGEVWIGEYRVCSSPAFFERDPNDFSQKTNLPYYDILLVHEDPKTGWHLYCNLMKDDQWKFLFELDTNNRPTAQTDMVEYQAYLDRKEQCQPLWKLSARNANRLYDALFGLVKSS